MSKTVTFKGDWVRKTHWNVLQVEVGFVMRRKVYRGMASKQSVDKQFFILEYRVACYESNFEVHEIYLPNTLSVELCLKMLFKEAYK